MFFKNKLIITPVILMAACKIQAAVPVIKEDVKIEQKVNHTLSKMTIDEKVGQMMEVVVDLLGNNDKNGIFHINIT